ncbi:hypothetical protein [Flavobacterium pectinovorum]|uniref:Uncharacterized protein n=1 Tax=Flavobacterium pectinovorum TaxID=29533 RepID=A0A502E5M8_9FLAO|nr:hypothetical protein [Flavobacterium pectinovorum]TPG32122.1 hypothetical protein EAH81_26190 [Flavobacterium pectinovorum]
MALTKTSFTNTDIEAVKSKKKSNSKIRIWISFFSFLILLIVYLSLGFDTSTSPFDFFKIIVIVINAFLIISALRDTNYNTDLSEKQKYIGLVKVKKKEYFYDNDNNSESHIINFDDWRIGEKSFREEYWNKINEGDEFYVEQATNSGVVFRLEKENIDFKIGLVF